MAEEAKIVELGATASVVVDVTNEHLASRLELEPGESFPAVFSTPWLLAQLERAAAKVLRPGLEEGQLSVGTQASIEHLAPTPAGQKITASARLTERRGPIYVFDVWAEDSAGVIGKGTHSRVIAPKAGVEGRAAKRFAPK